MSLSQPWAGRWPTAELGEVSDSRLGKMLSPASKNGSKELPYLGNADVQWGRIKLSGLRTMAFTPQEQREFALTAGDVLICEGGEAGRTAVVCRDLPGIFFQKALHRVRCTDRMDPRFLFRYMRYAVGSGALSDYLSQATIMHLTGVKLKRVPVPVPPIDEQRRIAAVLDKADELRVKRRAALALLDTLTESIFLDMFGDPVTNPMGWPVVRLAEAVELVQIGPFGSLLHQSDYVEGGTPLVNPMHIIGGRIVVDPRHAVGAEKLATLGRYILRSGDVVMGRRGEMGRCALVDPLHAGLVCGSGSLIIRPNDEQASGVYLNALLSGPAAKRSLEDQALGVTMANLNSEIVEGLRIMLPSLEVQRRYESAVLDRERVSQMATDDLARLDELFVSLQDRAFRGEL